MHNFDLIQRNETNNKSKGGTELLQDRLYDGSVPRELLQQFQIIVSRVRDLDESRYRIYWAHDLAGDPEAEAALAEGRWNRFHLLVFVSNWQMQNYISRYNLHWSKCIVINNSIVPITMNTNKPRDKIKIVYTPTPHRGLNILYSVFEALCREHDDIELDVFSSFKLYGWEERDEKYAELFELLEAHPKINYRGTQSNQEIRNALADSHIFAYPSVWPETSCLCLIEAMCAGLLCVHPNYGALYETALNQTYMYQWDEDINRHANVFYAVLDQAIRTVRDDNEYTRLKLQSQSIIANDTYSWKNKSHDWTSLLRMIIAQNPDKNLPKQMFSYRAGA